MIYLNKHSFPKIHIINCSSIRIMKYTIIINLKHTIHSHLIMTNRVNMIILTNGFFFPVIINIQIKSRF